MRLVLIVLFISLSGCAYPFFDDDAYGSYNSGYSGHSSEHDDGGGYNDRGREHGDSEHEHEDE